MDDAPAFPDWPAKRAAIRSALAAREPMLDRTGPVRAVPGAVTEPDGMRARVVARAVFLLIAGEVVPEMLVELAGAPLDQYAAAWEAYGGGPDADPWIERLAPDQQADDPRDCIEAMFNEEGPMWRWCERWGIPTWEDSPVSGGVAVSSREMDHATFTRHVLRNAWGLMETSMTLHAWRLYPFHPSAPPPFGQILEINVHRYAFDLALAAPLRLPMPWWDPQREDRASAIKRITADLDHAVRAELGRIEAEALRVAVPSRVKRTGLEHLTWLARYHFRRESFAAIAKDACVGRQTVADGVKDAADLIGLPLREPTPAGRPRRGR